MSERSSSAVDGFLVIDKPKGPTSHDLVGRVRRALRTRTVGHAGTLDPMATGVLVVAVGEATKLLRWLTAEDKSYRVTIALGEETDTLDAEGEVATRIARATPLTRAEVDAAVLRFVGTYKQRAPVFSAIKVDGVALHRRARRGEAVEAPEREVTVHRIDLGEVTPDRIELDVYCAKGFYVRSLGRDLARALGTCGHLTALRRLSSGALRIEDAVDAKVIEDAISGESSALRARMLPLSHGCRAMPRVIVDAAGAEDVRNGRLVVAARTSEPLPEAGVEPIAVFDEASRLLAIARGVPEGLRVIRGLRA